MCWLRPKAWLNSGKGFVPKNYEQHPKRPGRFIDADVVNLINVHNLDESFLNRLHPSIRRDFVDCLEEKRREDEYLARED